MPRTLGAHFLSPTSDSSLVVALATPEIKALLTGCGKQIDPRATGHQTVTYQATQGEANLRGISNPVVLVTRPACVDISF